MTTRSVVLITSVLALALLAVGVGLHEPSQAQQTLPVTSEGRYQMSVVGREGVSTVFIVDSMTGNCWYRDTHYNSKSWTAMGSPEQPPK